MKKRLIDDYVVIMMIILSIYNIRKFKDWWYNLYNL